MSLRGDTEKLAVLESLGAGIARLPISPGDYWDGGKALPERLDKAVLAAHSHGVRLVLLFEYYTRWGGELGGAEKWHAIGQAYAARFAPGSGWLKSQGIADWGIEFYTAFNEPMWKDNNPVPIPPDAYAEALGALADGVHEVGPGLHVSPGGYQEVPLFQNRNPYIKAAAPLFNAGKLWSIDIHRYWDVQYVPMSKGFNFSHQHQFEEVKRNAGITADVKFQTTEMNFKKRLVTEDEAAAGFLTALWDSLTVVGNDGKRVTQFVMPWNIFNLADKDADYGLCTQLSPWIPTARGKVLKLVCELTRGLEFVSVDPKGTGVSILEGGGRRLWVWQNRTGWSSAMGDTFTLTGIPAGARSIQVYGWDGLRKTVPLSGEEGHVLDGLTPGQTYLFEAVKE